MLSHKRLFEKIKLEHIYIYICFVRITKTNIIRVFPRRIVDIYIHEHMKRNILAEWKPRSEKKTVGEGGRSDKIYVVKSTTKS